MTPSSKLMLPVYSSTASNSILGIKQKHQETTHLEYQSLAPWQKRTLVMFYPQQWVKDSLRKRHRKSLSALFWETVYQDIFY